MLGDARSFSGLTSKIPPLGSMLNFDAGVTNVKTASRALIGVAPGALTSHRDGIKENCVFRWTDAGTHPRDPSV